MSTKHQKRTDRAGLYTPIPAMRRKIIERLGRCGPEVAAYVAALVDYPLYQLIRRAANNTEDGIVTPNGIDAIIRANKSGVWHALTANTFKFHLHVGQGLEVEEDEQLDDAGDGGDAASDEEGEGSEAEADVQPKKSNKKQKLNSEEAKPSHKSKSNAATKKKKAEE